MATRPRKQVVNENGQLLPDGEAWAADKTPRGALEKYEGDGDGDGDGAGESEVDSPIDRVLTVFGEGLDRAQRSRISLWRADPDTKVFGFCQDFTEAQIESGGLEMIRRKWGSGDFQLRVYGYRPGGTRYALLARPEFSLMAEPADAPAAAVAQQLPSGLESVLQTLAQGQQQLLQAVAQRPDPMAQMTQMLQLATMFKSAFGAGDTTGVATIVAQVKALKEAGSLFGGGGESEPKSDLAQLAELAQPLLTLITQQSQQVPIIQQPATLARNPNVSNAQPPRIAARPAPQHAPAPETGNPPAGQVAASQATQASSAEVVAPVVEASSAATGEPVASQVPAPQALASAEAEAAAVAHLRVQLSNLVSLAALNADTDAAAEQVYAEIPDEMLDLLFTDMWWPILSQVAPEVVPYRAWFDKVRARVMEIDDEENGASDEATDAQASDANTVAEPQSNPAG